MTDRCRSSGRRRPSPPPRLGPQPRRTGSPCWAPVPEPCSSGLCLVVAAWLRRRQQLVGVLLVRRGGSSAQITGVTLAAGVAFGARRRAGRHRRRRAGGRAARLGDGAQRRPGPGRAGCGRLGGGVGRCRCWSPWRCSPWLASPRSRAGRPPARAPPGTSRCSRWWPRRCSRSWCSAAESEPPPDRRHPAGSLPTLAVVASVVAVGLLTALVWPYLVTIGRRRREILTAASSTRIIARRRPLLPMVTAGFLAASCCLLVFTAGYRESLRQSGEDQAAYRVPLDVLGGAECPDRRPAGGARRQPAARGRARDRGPARRHLRGDRVRRHPAGARPAAHRRRSRRR